MSDLEMRRASLSVGEMAYADEGEGPPILLLHGFGTSSHLWRDLLPMLSIRSRVIAPDLMGFGASDRPADAPLGIGDQARYVGELVDHLELERFAAVGHDIGGAIAQILALERDVPTLVVMDGVTPWTVASEPLRQLQRADPGRADRAFAEGVIRATLDLGMGRRERLSDRDLEAYLEPWREDPAAIVRMAKSITSTGLEGREDDLAKLDVPALLLWGEDDPFVPPTNGERLWETLPDAAFAILPGCAHFITEDAAESVLPLVAQFLRRRYLGEEGHDHETGPVPVDLGISFQRPDPRPTELVDE
ncbi:MAG TPA: alpha/beta fold hydrolase [Actinomycetota bacterium]|nr:alpha/beta fold hydrolase [Actinomycetota bacterium]